MHEFLKHFKKLRCLDSALKTTEERIMSRGVLITSSFKENEKQIHRCNQANLLARMVMISIK